MKMLWKIRLILPIGGLALLSAMPAPAGAAPGGPLVYRTSAAPVQAQDHESAITLCPKGTELTGGGGRVSPATPQWGLTGAEPIDSFGPDLQPRDAYGAGVFNPGPKVRRVTAAAICMRRNLSRLHATTTSTVLPADQLAGGVLLGCPDGQDAVGGGGAIEGPFEGSTSLRGSGPFGADDGDPALDGWAVAARRDLGGEERTLTVDLRCLDSGVRALRSRRRDVTLDAVEARTLRVRCPRRFHVSGGGVVGDVSIFASMPMDGRDRDRAPDDGWRVRVKSTSIAQQPLSAYAICLR